LPRISKIAITVLAIAVLFALGALVLLAPRPPPDTTAPCANCVEYVELSPNNHFETEGGTISLESSSGYSILVRFVAPRFSKYPNKRFPAVLRIAGGWGPSTFLLEHPLTQKAAERGLVVVAFDSEPKTTQEVGSTLRNYNGFRDQDDVALVLQAIFEHPGIDPSRVGVWSHSNGITLAAGVLGRSKYDKLSRRVLFLLDDEGPHCPKDILDDQSIRFHTPGIRETWAKVIDAMVGQGREYASVDEFFSERCAVYFIGNFPGAYQRLQAIEDHEPRDYHGHAVAMLNAATHGKARWTRLNNEPKNRLYASPQEPDGINIESVLDVDKFESANDPRIWDALFQMFREA
jgi:hypothetical protein